jgi:hypothetical protein
MEGKVLEAKAQYERAGVLAKKVGFGEGVVNARAGLRRVMEVQKRGG